MGKNELIQEILKQVKEPIWENWYLKESIGSGAFSEVFRAEAKRSNRMDEAAVKIEPIVLDDGQIAVDENRKRDILDAKKVAMEHETSIMYELRNCPNIVTYEEELTKEFYINGVFEGYYLLIRMELLDNVYVRMRKGSFDYSEENILKLAEQIGNALKVAHAKKIIHRDIKPANFFISKDNVYKLGDFNISKKSESTRSFAGTQGYMAPEIFSAKSNVNDSYSTQADIYSLGICLYQMMNGGFLPFEDRDTSMENAIDMRMQGVRLAPPANASAEFGKIITKACEYDISKRYQTIEAMLADIKRYKNGIMISAVEDDFAPESNANKFVDPNATMYAGTEATSYENVGKTPQADPNATMYAGAEATSYEAVADRNQSAGSKKTSNNKTSQKPVAKKKSSKKFLFVVIIAIIAIVFFVKNKNDNTEDEAANDVANEVAVESVAEEAAPANDEGVAEEAALTAEKEAVEEIPEEEAALAEEKAAEEVALMEEESKTEEASADKKEEAEVPENVEYTTVDLMEVCPPYDLGYATIGKTTIQGEEYKNAIVFDGFSEGNAFAYFNLKGEYDVLEFDYARVDGTKNDNRNMFVITDNGKGEEREEILVRGVDALEHCKIDLDGAKQVRIGIHREYSGQTDVGIVNMQLKKIVSDGSTEIAEDTVTEDSSVEKINLMEVCQPYDLGHATVGKTTIQGEEYKNAIVFDGFSEGNAFAYFNLKGEYDVLEFDYARVDGTKNADRNMFVVTDNGKSEEREEILVRGVDALEHCKIDLDGAKQVRIGIHREYSGQTNVGIVNMQVQKKAGADASEKASDTTAETSSGMKDLMEVCPPYELGHAKVGKATIQGEEYKNAIVLDGFSEGNAYAYFNLKGEYNVLEFDYARIDGTKNSDRAMYVITDDGTTENKEEIIVRGVDALEHCKIDLDGAKQVRIGIRREYNGQTDVGIVNMKVE